ncbi:MAG: subclass B1 metallo-beta-lactamase, long type [Bacteroidota bacterium]
MPKNQYLSFLFWGLLHSLFGQTEKVSECLELTQLTASTYIHTCNNNNGLVYISDQEAIIISTPDSDQETQNLIDWVKNKAKIIGYVIDRWHPDAMGGLDVVHKNAIPSYANERTRSIAKEKGLAIAQVGFDEKLALDVGSQKIICHYLGEAHTGDGIVVWLPSEKILFGGNEIRNKGGWMGNIADANLSAWSKTAQSVKTHYGQAKVVVPGHGPYGSAKLIDFTIDLYSFPKNEACQDAALSNELIQENADEFHFLFSSKVRNEKQVIYSQGQVALNKKEKKIEIFADSILYRPNKRTVYVPTGCIRITKKNQVESFSFHQLYLNLREDEVEFTLVIKEIR